MERGMAAGEGFDIILVATAGDTGERVITAADSVDDEAVAGCYSLVGKRESAQAIIAMRVDPGVVEDEVGCRAVE
jgi:hypothetical protein